MTVDRRGAIWITRSVIQGFNDEKISARSVRFVGREVSNENEKGSKSKWNKPSLSVPDQLIEECLEVEKFEEDLRQKDGESASSKSVKDRESALEMRRIAMETFGESKKRKREEEEEENSKISKKNNSRNSGNNTIEYLREKYTQEMSLREKELQMKEKQQELEKQRYESR